jgi:2-keto-4-pentenoate hydratase/2-oxohepta-3-ene-1,7-dioic acid hydratase in catechol pathway
MIPITGQRSSNIPAVKEAGRTPPPFPFIFFKPTTTLCGHEDEVIIPKIAQDEQADYEGELVSHFASSLTVYTCINKYSA